jgi:hypothetical protein
LLDSKVIFEKNQLIDGRKSPYRDFLWSNSLDYGVEFPDATGGGVRMKSTGLPLSSVRKRTGTPLASSQTSWRLSEMNSK